MPTKIPHIPLHPVKSSQVESLGYDASSKTLAVKFIRTPGAYYYPGVSPEKFADLQKSESVGSFIHQHFVKNKHPFTKPAEEKKEGK